MRKERYVVVFSKVGEAKDKQIGELWRKIKCLNAAT
jgi:hypothetical protein